MPSLGQKLTGGLSAPRPARVSLNDGKFTLFMDSGAQHPTIPPALQLQVIFVGGNSHVSKVLYDGNYDADTPNAPKCWSDNGVAPSDQVPSPVSPTCAVCPNNRWVGQGAGATPPACMDRKKTAVLVAGAGDTVFLLDVPPASLKPFGKYMAYLSREVHEDPENIITKLTMENRVLKFESVGHVPDTLKPQIKKLVEDPATDDVVNEHDRRHQLSLAPPAPKVDFARLEAAVVEPIPTQFAPMTSNQAEAFHTPSAQSQVVEQFAEVVAEFAEPKARKPRGPNKPKETVVGPGPIPAATFDGVQGKTEFVSPSPFNERNPPPQFGMQEKPPAPPSDFNAMIENAFKLPLPGRP